MGAGRHGTPLCSARSEAPSMFSIRNIRYSLQNPPTMAHFQFDVTNPATHYTTRCSLDGTQLTPAPSGNGSVDDMWTPCENRTLLVINQTWYYDDVNPEYPIAFKGTAETRLFNLNCTSSPSNQVTEECTAPDASISIYQYWRDDLPTTDHNP
ncbi:hypothetical protein GGS24DRAFT_492218 [Hypoxylon argillaceum]|nr:hypothetical protein GGS24DRAFT_492218 [Hypoxylon argillaceum]